jgi:hypothetical protein
LHVFLVSRRCAIAALERRFCGRHRRGP